jgi:hypothetical protein
MERVPAAAPCVPALNLTGFEMTDAIVTGALSRGVRGSSMPAWGELKGDEPAIGQLNAVASYGVSLESVDALPETEMLASKDILVRRRVPRL